MHPQQARPQPPLYTAEERRRRDASPWTMLQGVLAPVQFIAFLISLVLVLRFLMTGEGLQAATVSVVIKTVLLYTIMVTGSIWEKEVFGVWLFARPFFWEDVFSFAVLALHSGYLIALATDSLGPDGLMWLALAAYFTYVINAGQFILKLRAARLQQSAATAFGDDQLVPCK
ncbi:MAG: 2-vinyl bacteriochlorophyllide hydratase [Methyloversatilis sp.]|uniref:2-vinyl bacteriochlorophyllide hydratase n=1 Tax=Methyloversatilis sp. TaxID=2569862 RepID=UPI001A57473C|nr:2-vinyl bacteriochlorophyllide hydratase [Methyloversatilis sp.]MBL8476468.1 2-vinyl bacteriochlorophyllide hydratase [Methyloversatilis sp.]